MSQREINIAQVKVFADLLANMAFDVPEAQSLQTQRGAYDAWGLASPLPQGTHLEAITLGGVSADRIAPRHAQEGKAILYLHGGGYGIGSPQSHRHLVGQLCEKSGLVGYSLAYRLAPETLFPGAVDDALAGYQGLLDLGLSRSSIIIAGDSAGGGLSIACALAIKAAGLPQPAGLFVMSPWADLSQSGPSYVAKADVDFIVSKQALDNWASAYLGDTDPRSPLASPVYGDLTGLAPILIQVGSEEVLLSDSITLASAAGLAKVDVTLTIAPDMPHVYPYMCAGIDEGARAIEAAAVWMERALTRA
jgi:epsilon-lactone hydrolase